MPGSVSDAYDPEFGTAANADAIASRLRTLYATVSHALGNQPPINIVELVHMDLPRQITASLTERDWRLIRFALERAGESL